MGDKFPRNRVPSGHQGLRASGERSTIMGPTYPEAKGESSNMWSTKQPKKGPNYVRG